MECDFGNEKSKTELEARLKACSGVLDNNRFLTVSETHEGMNFHACMCDDSVVVIQSIFN